MANSSSHKPSSPEITPKEEPVTLDKPESLNPFLPADQVEFIFEEIAFTTNNEVALLYPSHLNSEYFKEVSTPTGGIRGDIGINTFRNALRAHYLPHLNVPVDRKAPKHSSQIEEVPQGKNPGAKSGLRRKQSSKHTSESKTEAFKSKTGQSEKEMKSNSAKDKRPSHPSPPTPVVGEMRKEAQQVVGGPTSLGATSKEGAHPQLGSGTNPSVLVDQTKSAGDGLKTAQTNSSTNEESKADEISKKIKLEDLSDLLKDTRSAFFTPDFLQDEPIIVSDESEEEELLGLKAS
ncbi:hypothetical protein Tco_0749796 [Tanacetum coccineum]|uniref:Uncharacterized protein n=1 Tax=Tanacetum coccineum TaxID=301880 RepID=A0ABQ4Z0H0_9ASTR